MRLRLARVRNWVRRQMGATEDSPWRGEPESWPEVDTKEWLRETMRRFGARAVFVLVETEPGVTIHLAAGDRTSIVRRVAVTVRRMAEQSGAHVFNRGEAS